MIEKITSVMLPVDEELRIQKNRLCPEDGGNGKRISIVTGIHGDELEGQYVCYELIRRITEHPEYLCGTVDVYPAMNPLGIDSVSRGIPGFDLDMNRLFPGSLDGAMTEYLAAGIINDLLGSSLCIDIHASNIYLTEMPQIRINELHKDMLLPYACRANVDFVWIHGASTVLEATLAHSLNSRQTPTLVVEMGVGMRITKEYGEQLTEGIFSLMKSLDIWRGPAETVKKPLIGHRPDEVCFLNAPVSGIFQKESAHGVWVAKGQSIGKIIDPLRGKLLADVTAPQEGLLFTIREYPVVSEGSLLARILQMSRERWEESVGAERGGCHAGNGDL
ncbi:MAG: M14 family metallopeptidase [Lachnospiraceae bacterium]|nr:M14 family metallopeptidase [Lachnospiraceae bacterium]